MGLDLAILAITLLVALFGAFSGASRQIGHVVGLLAGVLLARPVGGLLREPISRSVDLSEGVVTVIAAALAFLLVLFSVRALVALILRRILGAGDPEDRTLDRWLGGALGAVKSLAVAWLVVSTLTFMEQHVRLRGRPVLSAPGDSVAVAVTRRYNLLDRVNLPQTDALVELSRRANDPEAMKAWASSPAARALIDDPRVVALLEDEDVRKAAAEGNTTALFERPDVQRLLADPELMGRLSESIEATGAQQARATE